MDKLLPCPLCGGQPELEDHRTAWGVHCDCGCCVIGDRAPEPEREMPDEYWARFEKSAVDKWNTRADDKRIAELEHYNLGLANESCEQQKRIAELEANCERLRRHIERAYEYTGNWGVVAKDLLSETPTQSLQHIRNEAVREFAVWIGDKTMESGFEHSAERWFKEHIK